MHEDKVTKYEEFIARKSDATIHTDSITVSTEDLNPSLFQFEKDIVRWALAKGRAAVFADCGLGKSIIQLEWAKQIIDHKGGMVLILAPLSVTPQTVREGNKFGIPVTPCETIDDLRPGINITNYEKLDKFAGAVFTGVVLDESSILKAFSGKVRNQIIDAFCETPFRLACTATPAPNDFMELGNHAEFLGIMSYPEMLAMWFVHDGGRTSKWRLKGHAEQMFWEWMAQWAVVLENPKDLGYEISGYDLPPLAVHEVIVDGDEPDDTPMSLLERRAARRESLEERCAKAYDIAVSKYPEQTIIWCGLNAEQDRLEKLFGDQAYSIRGSTKNSLKIEYEYRWRNGERPVLITKPECCALGMNWQHCTNEIFVGLSDSYEQYYQALRRCWRFGQENPVDAYIVISKREGTVKDNIARKDADSRKMRTAMIEQTKEITKKELRTTCRLSDPYEPDREMILPKWEEFLNACA